MATPPISAPAVESPAVFVKALQNSGSTVSAAQYVSFGHCFQKGQMAEAGMQATIGGTVYPCQVDVKTKYADGSACHAIVTLQWPSVGANSIAWGQFAPSAAPSGSALVLSTALGSTTASIALTGSTLPDWTASNAYATNAVIRPTVGNAGGYIFQFPGNSGSSGATEPTWPQTPGAAVADGTLNAAGSLSAGWYNVGKSFSGTITEDLIAAVKAVTADPWRSGPLAVEGRAYVLASNPAPLASATTNSALPAMLRLVIDATAFADGTVLLDVCIANDCYPTLSTTGGSGGGGLAILGGTQAYSATITLNGSAVLSSDPLLHNAQENWAWQFGTVPHLLSCSQDVTLQVVHNPTDFTEAQAIVPYDWTVGVGVDDITGGSPLRLTEAQNGMAAPSFAKPMTVNATFVNQDMPDYGVSFSSSGIGPNNYWHVWWLLTGAQGFWGASMESARVNGVIPWHNWNPNVGRYWSFSEDELIQSWPERPDTASGPFFHIVPVLSIDSLWNLDWEHYPDLVSLSYLLTGRRYFFDELIAVSEYVQQVNLFNQNAYATVYPGVLNMFSQVVSARQQGWAFRNQLYAAYAYPDADPHKQAFRACVDTSLAWFCLNLQFYQNFEGEPYGWMPAGYGGEGLIAPWQFDYTMFLIGLAATMGHPLALQMALWMLHFRAGVLLNGSSWPPDGMPPAEAIIYDMAMWNILPNTFGRWGTTWLSAQSWTGIEQALRVVTGSGPQPPTASNTCDCIFEGTISGLDLTVTSVLYGALEVGMTVFVLNAGVLPVLASGSGTSWTLNAASGFSPPSGTITMSASNYNQPGKYIYWWGGIGGGGGNLDNYDQVLYDSLIQGEILGHPDAATAITTLEGLKDSTGVVVPNLDTTSWENALIWKLASRTWNDSQVFPAAGASNATEARSLGIVGAAVSQLPAAPATTWFPARPKRVYFGNRR